MITGEIVGRLHPPCRHLSARRKGAVGRASGIVVIGVASRLEIKPVLQRSHKSVSQDVPTSSNAGMFAMETQRECCALTLSQDNVGGGSLSHLLLVVLTPGRGLMAMTAARGRERRRCRLS